MPAPLAKRARRANLYRMTDYSQMDRDEAARNETQVRDGFWNKARKTLGQVPFSEQAVAAFYCATDSATPLRIRGALFGALGYFILPIDTIPDFILALGYTDDAAILLGAIAVAQAHITDEHRAKARAWLLKEQAA